MERLVGGMDGFCGIFDGFSIEAGVLAVYGLELTDLCLKLEGDDANFGEFGWKTISCCFQEDFLNDLCL